MADENKLGLEIEIDSKTLEASFGTVDKRAEKSAKGSAAVFGEAFQKQEQAMKQALDKLVGDAGKAARVSAKESAAVFEKEFKRTNDILLASQKQNINNALDKITNVGAIKKSAAESASAFQDLLPPLEQPRSPFNLTNIAAGVYLLKQAFHAVKEVAGAMSDFIAEGENIKKGEARFEALADQAGVAADVIRTQLVGAAKGLVDDDELLKLASTSFVELGKNASRLPEILDLARRSYKVFGGDVVTNADKISQAVFTQNTRALRNMGIMIDAQKVLRDYATAKGTIVELLGEETKQGAILNAILEQGQTRFKNVTVEANSYNDALKRAKVSLGDLVDEGKRLASDSVGDFFAKGLDRSAKQMDAVKMSISSMQQASSIPAIEAQIVELNAALNTTNSEYEGLTKIDKLFASFAHSEMVDKLTNDLARMNAELAIAKGDAASRAKGGAKPEAGPKVDPAVQAEYLKRRQELVARVREMNLEVEKSDMEALQAEAKTKNSSILQNQIYLSRKKQEDMRYQKETADLEKFYGENGVNDAALRYQGREALRQKHEQNMKSIHETSLQDLKRAKEEEIETSLSVTEAYDAVMDGFEDGMEEKRKSLKKTMKEIGTSMKEGIGMSAANAFAAFGSALANGDDALQAFARSFISSIGQMAIQSGSRFIMEGIAWSTVPGFESTGAAMISAGAALAAFGGALTALGNPQEGGGGASVKSGEGEDTVPGGGVTGEGSSINTGDFKTEPKEPKAVLNLTVQGNILDRRETGLELANIISEQFADQGLILKQG